MSEYKFHPLAELFPLMEGEEFDALVADIKVNGLREKIDLYRGKIVEGRNRYRALRQLGIDPNADPKKYFRKAIYAHTTGGEIAAHEQDNDARVRAYIISKNIHRRHLTAEQKRDLVAKLIKATPEKSDLQIAKTVKVSPTTVGTVRTKMEAAGDVSKLETRTDSLGRKQPAKKRGQRKPRTGYIIPGGPLGHSHVSKAEFEAYDRHINSPEGQAELRRDLEAIKAE